MENVVVIGRPNVGKSTLFNRICGKKRALVHHEPGTTRDRNEMPVEWNGKKFQLIDTGGWEDNTNYISAQIRRQMEEGLKKAGLVLFAVDGKNGYHPLDGDIAAILRKYAKKVILLINKIDTEKEEVKASDFFRLGFDDYITVSGTHGLNINTLLDKISASVKNPKSELLDIKGRPISIVLVGKPNVGKSSLLNKLMKEDRVIVNDQPGTTREAVDITIERDGQQYVIIDTPGLHRKHKFKNDMEYLSTLSANWALERADVAILVIDATIGVGETEARIAELILKNHRGCIIALNKWDLVEEREDAVKDIKRQLEQKLQFLWWSEMIFISAKTGQRTERILTEVNKVYNQYTRIVPEQELKDTIDSALRNRPLSRKGKILRVHKVVQHGAMAPCFVFTVNSVELVHFSYRRYLENAIRDRFGFQGTPLVLKFKSL